MEGRRRIWILVSCFTIWQGIGRGVLGFTLPTSNNAILCPSTSRNPRSNDISRINPRIQTQLNGIRGFRSWFESQFPNAMKTIEHSQKYKQTEQFHHVLIDMNQLLHVTLRRSRSEGHALILLIQELDKAMEIASPTRSIVLAFDGPPAAAKLATQRRRRRGTVLRAERKKARMELLIERGLLPQTTSNDSVAKKRRRKDKAQKEEETLRITPGTLFMDRAHEAVLYWAWQRLEGKGKLSTCRIYISPSTVPGEGEVKLLDWLIQAGSDNRPIVRLNRKSKGKVSKSNNKKKKKQTLLGLEMDHNKKRIVRPGESVAIMGGDSDLVLEGLCVPPSITHNVFVILPSGGSTSYVVSLWETTLTLGKYLGKKFDPAEIMRVRTDLVLLLIMNGNDYLPKLRGSAGFNKLFHTYLSLLKKWIKTETDQKPYLVDPDTLEFNLPFCLAFFRTLAKMAPKQLATASDISPLSQSVTALSQLYSMVDAGFLPSPADFERIQIPGSNDGTEILRLTLGNGDRHSVTGKKFQYELRHKITSERPLKKAKQDLANIALEELLGADYSELNDLFPISSNGDSESDSEDSDFDFGGYSWEIRSPAESSVPEYLKGLLWNLSTYQDGVCSNYSFNYGRRMSPTADEVVSYFEDALNSNLKVDRELLLSDPFVNPLSSELSCLAALPSQVDYLIKQPYRQLSVDGTVEKIYGDCMDPETNVFDMALFDMKCKTVLRELDHSTAAKKEEVVSQRQSKLRQIRTGDSFWTVIRKSRSPLVHPFKPPLPFTTRLSNLRYNPLIKATHILASDRPRWLRDDLQKSKIDTNSTDLLVDDKQSDMGKLLINALGDETKLENVGYKTPYQPGNIVEQTKNRKKSKSRETFEDFDNKSLRIVDREIMQYEIERMKKYKIDAPKLSRNSTDGFNALQCLQQFYDGDLISDIDWNIATPSKSKYASRYPDLYEEIKLSVVTVENKAISIRQDRNTKLFSRKVVKHSLASNVMVSLFEHHDKEWYSMSVKEMKSLMIPSHKSNSTVEDVNALQCLHQLKDARLVQVTWHFYDHDHIDTIEYVELTIENDAVNFSFSEERNVNQHSKMSLKHRLANKAMEKLVGGEDCDWRSMTLSELKEFITKL